MAPKKKKKNAVEIIADKILKLIRKAKKDGTPLPWHKPWAQGPGIQYDTETVTITPEQGHFNGCSGHVYKGLNQWFLDALSQENDYTSQAWTTFKQAKKVATLHLIKLGYVPASTKENDKGEIVAGWDWSWGGEGKAPLGADPCPGVRKGEESTEVFYWSQWMRWVDAEGNTVRKPTKAQIASGAVKKKTTPSLRVYRVFNFDQCDSMPAPRGRSKQTITYCLPVVKDPAALGIPQEVADQFPQVASVFAAFAEATGCTLTNAGNRAFYNITQHAITMPTVAQFVKVNNGSGVARYAATLLHEITHATGNKAVLDRQFGKRFGDEAYAFEELVAEIGSASLCQALGVPSALREDHASYVASWLKVLDDDKYSIHTAAKHSRESMALLLDAVTQDAAEDTQEAEETAQAA